MEIRRLPATEAALERHARELWLPYHRDLAAAVDAHALADRPDEELIEAETAFRLDRLSGDGSHRIWVVTADPDANPSAAESADIDLDDVGPDDVGPNDVDLDSPAATKMPDPEADLVAFVSTSVDACPAVFDRPDRLIVGDLYVASPFRGSGLADWLLDRAVADARDHGCEQLRLDADVDNERAMRFYERMGFEEYRKQLTMAVDRP